MAAQTVSEHLRAAVGLALRNPSALQEFGTTQTAFWWSFRAALVALPLFVVSVVLGDRQADGLVRVVAELGPYAVGWLLFPVAMLQVVQTIDRERYYCRYIVAVNWCSVVEYGLLAALVLLRSAGVLPVEIANIVFFAMVIWVLTYQHFVARTALQVEGMVAALIVGLRMVLDLVIVAFSGVFGG